MVDHEGATATQSPTIVKGIENTVPILDPAVDRAHRRRTVDDVQKTLDRNLDKASGFLREEAVSGPRESSINPAPQWDLIIPDSAGLLANEKMRATNTPHLEKGFDIGWLFDLPPEVPVTDDVLRKIVGIEPDTIRERLDSNNLTQDEKERVFNLGKRFGLNGPAEKYEALAVQQYAKSDVLEVIKAQSLIKACAEKLTDPNKPPTNQEVLAASLLSEAAHQSLEEATQRVKVVKDLVKFEKRMANAGLWDKTKGVLEKKGLLAFAEAAGILDASAILDNLKWFREGNRNPTLGPNDKIATLLNEKQRESSPSWAPAPRSSLEPMSRSSSGGASHGQSRPASPKRPW